MLIDERINRRQHDKWQNKNYSFFFQDWRNQLKRQAHGEKAKGCRDEQIICLYRFVIVGKQRSKSEITDNQVNSDTWPINEA